MIGFAPISPPDPDAESAARARQDVLTKPRGALGRLEDLSVWVAACQGHCPPRQFQRARVVVFAGDHGVARSGVSAYPPEVTDQMVANIDAGGAAINALADVAGATVRVADLAVDSDAVSERIGAYKVRRGSGDISTEDALTADETARAIASGQQIADEEVDAGADLLIAGDMGIGNTTAAAVLVAALTDTEPVAVVGFGTGIDDAGWARKTAAVRDALFRARSVLPDPVGLLRCCGGADLAAMAGFCAQAAVRRTPLLLDGMAVTAAALVAERLAPGARQWWQAGHRSTEPGHQLALTALQLDPILDLRMRLGEGTGATLALSVLRAAVAALSSMATFTEAGVSGPRAPPVPDRPGRDPFPGNSFRLRHGDAHAEFADRSDGTRRDDGAARGRRGTGWRGRRCHLGRCRGLRAVQPVVRVAGGDGVAGGNPRPAHRRRCRYGRRPGLLRPGAARPRRDARRVVGAVRGGRCRPGHHAAGAGLPGAGRRRCRRGSLRRPDHRGAGLSPVGSGRRRQRPGCARRRYPACGRGRGVARCAGRSFAAGGSTAMARAGCGTGGGVVRCRPGHALRAPVRWCHR
ncbi:nicotinate-nucleotide--dimethylbenzimidazole phosphoribosyltransferase [Mycobacterium kansasii 824]|nr:nicotinate-nucleotide--dimethylbenzimidazole phosphoribosyltransferase [Mycobacterium kansasii 824]